MLNCKAVVLLESLLFQLHPYSLIRLGRSFSRTLLTVATFPTVPERNLSPDWLAMERKGNVAVT